MASDKAGFGDVEKNIAIHNLARLAALKPVRSPELVDGLTPSLTSDHGPFFDDLKRWTDANVLTIQKAKKCQVFGGGKDEINFETAFLPFLESCGTYLRDWDLLSQAVNKYDPSQDNNDEALKFYHDAHQPIRDLAGLWGMNFVVLVDLLEESPDGHGGWFGWDGPYCGAYYPLDTSIDPPFIGVAFKGTNPLKWGQVLVDFNYQLVPAQGYLDGKKVSQGVYTSLFGTFKDGTERPFDIILGQLEQLAQTLIKNKPVGGPKSTPRVHVTGHSLGASYSMMCYAQLLIQSSKLDFVPSFMMGDQYTFGGPRVGSNSWAQMNHDLTTKTEGKSWRVVHSNDIVPQVPPTTLQPTEVDFHHIDNGVKIWDTQAPQKLPSERNMPDPPLYPITDIWQLAKILADALKHTPLSYYKAMMYAINSKQPSKPVPGILPKLRGPETGRIHADFVTARTVQV